MKQSKILLLSALLSCGFSLPVVAGIAVVVHPDNANKLDDAEVRRIFLGKARAYPDGSEVQPLDQEVGAAVRNEFMNKILKKSEGQLNAYWARMLFSSKATPPKVVKGSDEIKKMVASNPRAIAYIDSSAVDSSVKVLYQLP